MTISFVNQQKCIDLVMETKGDAMTDMDEYYKEITRKLGSGKMMIPHYQEYQDFMEHKWGVVYQRLEAKYGIKNDCRP